METKTNKRQLRFDLANSFAALKYRNYRLWFLGQLASLIGTWMQTTAQGFLIFQLTHSPVALGYVTFASGIPAWLLMLYGGVIIDRVSRRTILIVTQTAMMVLAFILAVLAFSGIIQSWHILVLALLLGIANAFDAPARQAFVVDLIDREDLTNGIALNSTMFQTATAVGPAVAGLTYAAFGPAWCFTINGISFIAVIAALLCMHIPSKERHPLTATAWQSMREGLGYALGQPVIRTVIGLIGVMGFFTTAYITLFPAWAVTVLHGDATVNGWLQSARGLGALLGALTISLLGRFEWKGRLLTIGSFFFPAALIVYALISSVPLALIALVAAGWGFLVLANLAGTLLQTLVPEALRGRVTGLYSLVAFGSMPLGGLAAGALAQDIGMPLTVILGALVLLLFSAGVMVFVPQLKQVE
jgi:predicted MFS family arabinose efflux permease